MEKLNYCRAMFWGAMLGIEVGLAKSVAWGFVAFSLANLVIVVADSICAAIVDEGAENNED